MLYVVYAAAHARTRVSSVVCCVRAPLSTPKHASHTRPRPSAAVVGSFPSLPGAAACLPVRFPTPLLLLRLELGGRCCAHWWHTTSPQPSQLSRRLNTPNRRRHSLQKPGAAVDDEEEEEEVRCWREVHWLPMKVE